MTESQINARIERYNQPLNIVVNDSGLSFADVVAYMLIVNAALSLIALVGILAIVIRLGV